MPKQPTTKPIAGENNLPNAVKHFDQLPDSARINSRTLKTLLGISDTTFWRRRKADIIPAPDMHGTWSAATAREILNGSQEVA